MRSCRAPDRIAAILPRPRDAVTSVECLITTSRATRTDVTAVVIAQAPIAHNDGAPRQCGGVGRYALVDAEAVG